SITVTGVASATDLRNVPSQVSVLSKKNLEQNTGTTLLDAIAKLPGVSIVTTGPAIAKPFIRGLGYNRVVTLNDGVRQEGQQWGDEHGIEVDEYSAKRIEVLKGPASLMYGSDAIGGVVNIITNTPIPDKTIRANYSGSYNSNNRLWGQFLDVSGNNNGFNWNAYGSFKNAGDYKNKYDGGVLNSRFNEKNFGGYVGLNKSWGYSHLIFSNYDQRIGMVEGERDAQGSFILDGYTVTDKLLKGRKPLVPNQHVSHTKLAWDNLFVFKNEGRLTALAAYQHNKRREFGDPVNPDEAEAFFDLKTINYNIAYHLPVTDHWKTSIGMNGMQQKNLNKGEEAIIPDYNLFDWGAYLYTSYSLNKTTFSGGVRYDIRSMDTKLMMDGGDIKFDAVKKDFQNFSASVGMVHSFNQHFLLKANISRGFRAPNASELSANGEHEGTGRYEIGNAALKNETSLSFDAGVQLTTNHVDMTLTGFYNNIDQFIFYRKLLDGNGADSLIDGAQVFKFTQQDASLAGIEASVDIHPHPLDWLHFENTFSWVRGSFKQAVDGSKNLPLMAPVRLITELRGEFKNKNSFLSNLYIKLEMDNVATQDHFFAGYDTETKTSGYTLFNAGAGADFIINGQKRASLVLAVNNITDKAYQSHLSRLKYLDENPQTGRVGVFNMGRNVTAKLIIPFQWKLN
ncbi:MAG: TonB-dependent receptor, partial [Niabella sp.]